MATEEVSLRPMALRPGGGAKAANPFAAFGKGAGASLSKKVIPILGYLCAWSKCRSRHLS